MNTLHIEMINEICKKLGCEFIDIFTSRRGKELSIAKKVIYWILRKEGLGYHQIGLLLKKDHTSVMKGITTLPAEYKSYAQAVYNKFHRKGTVEQQIQEQQMLEERLKKIVELLNAGKNLKEIAQATNDTYQSLSRLVDLYVCEKKIPNYSTYSQKSEFFYKIIKKNY